MQEVVVTLAGKDGVEGEGVHAVFPVREFRRGGGEGDPVGQVDPGRPRQRQAAVVDHGEPEGHPGVAAYATGAQDGPQHRRARLRLETESDLGHRGVGVGNAVAPGGREGVAVLGIAGHGVGLAVLDEESEHAGLVGKEAVSGFALVHDHGEVGQAGLLVALHAVSVEVAEDRAGEGALLVHHEVVDLLAQGSVAGGKVKAVAHGGEGRIGAGQVEVGRHLHQVLRAGIEQVEGVMLGNKGHVVAEADELFGTVRIHSGHVHHVAGAGGGAVGTGQHPAAGAGPAEEEGIVAVQGQQLGPLRVGDAGFGEQGRRAAAVVDGVGAAGLRYMPRRADGRATERSSTTFTSWAGPTPVDVRK